MLNIKSFLLALCVSPLAFNAFQPPVIAGNASNAGSASGVFVINTPPPAPPIPSFLFLPITQYQTIFQPFSPFFGVPGGFPQFFGNFGLPPFISGRFINAFSRIFPGQFGPVGADPLGSNLNASLLKSFDKSNDTLLAQSKANSIDTGALAETINIYNEILDTSSPEVLTKLSENKDFIAVGDALRNARDVVAK